jgi:hypothetical protein
MMMAILGLAEENGLVVFRILPWLSTASSMSFLQLSTPYTHACATRVESASTTSCAGIISTLRGMQQPVSLGDYVGIREEDHL